MTYKPYPLDWRFLPEPLLELKDTLRHLFNKAGGGSLPSGAGKLWFRHFRRRQISAIAKAGVLFVHVPRTAGTSISQVLYGQNLPHVSASYWRALNDPHIRGLPSFAVVRSPVRRIASSYRFIRCGGTDLMACSRYDPLGLRNSPSLEAFVEALALSPSFIRSYDVLRPQADFVTDAFGRLTVDRLFSFEGLVRGAVDLCDWLGINHFPALNASEEVDVVVPRQTRELIERLYREDVDLHESTLRRQIAPKTNLPRISAGAL